MSKRSKNRRGREPSTFASRAAPDLSFVRVTSTPLTLLEDRRTYHPLGGLRPPLSFTHRVGRIAPVDRQSKSPAQRDRFGEKVRSQTKALLTFEAPKAVALCVRRQRRKEVIHALGKAGGKHRRPRRNPWSSISCKR